MKALLKCGAVLGGYVAAVLAASLALEIRLLHTQSLDVDPSSGMYAFGDMLLFLAVFGSVAVFPTGLALYFLRPYRWLWIALAVVGLALAATGPFATALCVLASHISQPGNLLLVCSALAVLRVLAAPLLAGGFLVACFIAPGKFSRWALSAATASEGAVAVYAVVHWYVGPCFI